MLLKPPKKLEYPEKERLAQKFIDTKRGQVSVEQQIKFAQKHRSKIYANKVIEAMRVGYNRARQKGEREVHILLPAFLFNPSESLAYIYNHPLRPEARKNGVYIEVHTPGTITEKFTLNGVIIQLDLDLNLGVK